MDGPKQHLFLLMHIHLLDVFLTIFPLFWNLLFIFPFAFSAVDRHRCIIQPDKPQFTSGVALLTTLLMVTASILLSLPMYQSAEVRNLTSFFKWQKIVLVNTLHISSGLKCKEIFTYTAWWDQISYRKKYISNQTFIKIHLKASYRADKR